ncbi:DUF1203 domain-containing protein [Erythrobacter sp.]|uniref:DUF1203 domain-containing protein n=1 Tax=Erythrobacter sp. TaxID=1042 RepID=UPI00311FED96
MHYLIEGIDPAPYRQLFELDDAALAARNIVRVTADGKPGFPCRVTLDEAEVGETLLLLNHTSRDGDTPYCASHAIFVREAGTAPARFVDSVPPVFGPRKLSLRGFDASGMMIDAMITEPGEAAGGLETLFANPEIVEIDVHNAVRGCFAARARRA